MLPFFKLIKPVRIVVMLISVMVLNACKDSDKNSSLIFEELNESLERSNESLNQEISASLRYLQYLTEKPETAEKGAMLLPKAKLVESYSLKVTGLIDSLTRAINTKIITNSFVNERKEKNFISDIFIEGKGGLRLHKSFINYRKDILNIDERIKKELKEKMPIANNKFRSLFTRDEEFIKMYFDDKRVSQALTILSKFKNDVLFTEHQAILSLKASICVLNIMYDN